MPRKTWPSLIPLPTVVASEPDQLHAATVALLRGEVDVARHLIDRMDRDALWLYYDAAGWVYEARHETAIHRGRTRGENVAIPIAMKREVAARDGWRCRFCGLRLVSRDLIVGIHAQLGDAFVIDANRERLNHPAAFLLRYTQDHVIPSVPVAPTRPATWSPRAERASTRRGLHAR